MVLIDPGDEDGNVLLITEGGGGGHDRGGLGVAGFQVLGGVRFHGGEDQIHGGGVELRGVLHGYFGEGRVQGFLAIPAEGAGGVGDGVLINLARRTLAGGQSHHLEPGMAREGGQELLARHPRGADDRDCFLFHG